MIPLAPVAASVATQAYAKVAGGVAEAAGQAASSFGDALGRALDGVIGAGHQADDQAAKALLGTGNLTEAATAVSRAELALQGAVAVRDKVVQAYQDVMRMPI